MKSITPTTQSAAMSILIVEDEPADVTLLKLAFRDCGVTASLSFATNGEQALADLRSSESPHDLLLLDLSLPRKNGKEVLKEIRADAALRNLPVAMFTSSLASQDVADCYRLGANCYIGKPNSYPELLLTVRQLTEFWLQVVRLPPKTTPHPGASD